MISSHSIPPICCTIFCVVLYNLGFLVAILEFHSQAHRRLYRALVASGQRKTKRVIGYSPSPSALSLLIGILIPAHTRDISSASLKNTFGKGREHGRPTLGSKAFTQGCTLNDTRELLGTINLEDLRKCTGKDWCRAGIED